MPQLSNPQDYYIFTTVNQLPNDNETEHKRKGKRLTRWSYWVPSFFYLTALTSMIYNQFINFQFQTNYFVHNQVLLFPILLQLLFVLWYFSVIPINCCRNQAPNFLPSSTSWIFFSRTSRSPWGLFLECSDATVSNFLSFLLSSNSL